MDFTNMETGELIERRNAIAQELETADAARLDELTEEARGIKEELEARKAAEAKRNALRTTVAEGAGETTRTFTDKKEKPMTEMEIRKSEAYVNAFADYIKSGDDSACRALLTTNATNPATGNSNTVPVPVIVEERVRTAWEKSGLLDEVTKTYVRGNLRVGFELSATDAAVHAEGTDAPAEEQLTLGVVSLVPQSIKKWIRISDEAYDMGGEAFLNYIYDEITHRIAQKAKALLVAAIAGASTTSSATAVGVAKITGAPSLAIVAQAVANLSDEADRVSVVMNRLTHADFVAAIAANGFKFDPFEGIAVHYDNTLPAYSAASSGDVWMIAGDFSGAQMNFPNGQDIRLKFDDLSEAEADLIKIVGRMFVAIGVVAPGHFCNVAK